MLISLGFSCQTRFMIDALAPELKRQPFDFNITSRAALIRALATDGQSLQHAAGDAAVYTMPGDGRQGVDVSGMYLWHDYPLGEDRLALSPVWREKIVQVNGKYAMLWARFAALLRSDVPKVLVLGNAQRNLVEFSAGAEDFTQKFGLGRRAYAEISAALEGFGARAWRLKFLSRTEGEVAETAGIDGDRLDHRFVGPLALRPDPALVAELFAGELAG